jgi:hypothetical protein
VSSAFEIFREVQTALAVLRVPDLGECAIPFGLIFAAPERLPKAESLLLKTHVE